MSYAEQFPRPPRPDPMPATTSAAYTIFVLAERKHAVAVALDLMPPFGSPAERVASVLGVAFLESQPSVASMLGLGG